MHLYALLLTEYNERGALTSNKTLVTVDTPLKLAQEHKRYSDMQTVIYDEEGNPTQTFKKYKVEPQIACYVAIEDFEEFKRVNHVIL